MSISFFSVIPLRIPMFVCFSLACFSRVIYLHSYFLCSFIFLSHVLTAWALGPAEPQIKLFKCWLPCQESGSGRRLQAYSSSVHFPLSLRSPSMWGKCCTLLLLVSQYIYFLCPLLFIPWHFPRVLINFNTWFNFTFDLMQKAAGSVVKPTAKPPCWSSSFFPFSCARLHRVTLIVEAQGKYFRSFMGHRGTLSTA